MSGHTTDGGGTEGVYPESEVLMATTYGPQAFLQQWANAVRSYGVRVQTYPHEIGDLSKVEFAVCYAPEPGLLGQCPNLKAIQSMGSGVSPGMLEERVCPTHIPMLRVVDPLTCDRMSTFVLWAVMNHQRKGDAYLAAQRQRRWDKNIENFTTIDCIDLNIGIMGLGPIGAAVADRLLVNGYNVSSWTRTARQKEGVRCFSGWGELKQFAGQANVIVNLLALTEETRGILKSELFSWLPQGTLIINVSRGQHIVNEDLIAALDSGQLAGAVLDVFDKEPLPQDSPLWGHPKIRISPHIAAVPHIPSVVPQVIHNRRCILEGRPVPPERVVDRQRGY